MGFACIRQDELPKICVLHSYCWHMFI